MWKFKILNMCNEVINLSKETFDLGTINEKNVIKKNRRCHISSIIQPDTLFTFTTDLKWLIDTLEHKMISPRYCNEDIRYLKIKYKHMAYPMKCFCDINMQKLDYHMEWYGDYGIAFTKEWGIEKNIQPVHYLNEYGNLRKDITKVLKKALNENIKKEHNTHKMLKDYLLHELMFYKPYQGRIKNGKTSTKCFADECEWRYVPNVNAIDLPQVIWDDDLLNSGLLTTYSNAMNANPDVSLCFDYNEIKHIIIQTQADYKILVEAIDTWDIINDKYNILSKVLVWDQIRRDF